MKLEITRTTGSDDFTNVRVYADDRPRNAADYIERLIGSKSPDQIYEASIPFGNNCQALSIEGGYRLRFNAVDPASLEQFLDALSKA